MATDLNELPPGSGRLQGRVACVTGGSSSIGRAICLAYAREGAIVVVADITDSSRAQGERAISTHDLITKNGGQAIYVKTDVANSESVNAVVAEAANKFGRLDIMVNNAGIISDLDDPQPIWDTTDSNWNRTLSINCTGVFHGVRAAARQMKDQMPHPTGDRGWIINLSSIFGLVANEKANSYVASKHLVMGLTKSAALDLAPFRVHVNAINPGFVNTTFLEGLYEATDMANMIDSLHPFRGVGHPGDIARIAIFLASDDARWVHGQGIVVDGGYTAR